jgi:glucose/arabinose dehydrogenase
MKVQYSGAVCGLVIATALAGTAVPARLAIAQTPTQAEESTGDYATTAADPTGAGRKSGYTPAKEMCGTAPLAFPRLRIGMRAGYCAGLVASKEDGLIFPRTIVQVPDTRFFVVADMGGWSAKQGRLLLLDPQAAEGKRIKVLMTKLDVPHGLAVGIDRRIYASTADTVFRFDPMAPQPESTVEVILQGLPGLQPTLSDGTKLERNSLHPLKHFIFDKTGRIFVNVGAPTDNCGAQTSESKTCVAGEGGSPLASVWVFTPPAGGVFPALKPGAASPPHEVFARGLRNSMALAVHPQFPAPGFAFMQGENGRDLPDIYKPNEEINALEKGRHYGWPYCYDLTTASPEYKAFLLTRTPYQNLCSGNAIYKQPYSLLPPHAAPLSMFYYQADKFPELKGKLVVGLHGYRPTGSRVIFYDVDAKGFPVISPAPVNYNVSCAAQPTRPFQTEQEPRVPAAAFKELISDWHRLNGVRPQGAPVGMTVAVDGAIWLVEDKNQTILRIDAAPTTEPTDILPCDSRSEAQIKELIALSAKDPGNRARLTTFRGQVVEKHCMGCHTDFDLKAGMNDAQKDATVLHFLLTQDGWVYPGDPESGLLHSRVWGKGVEKIMPDDGQALIAKDAAYKQALDQLDLLVAHTVPGERRRIKLGRGVALAVHNRAGRVCGSIPNNTLVVVVDKTSDKPGLSRIFRPADQYLNGECVDSDGYYVTANDLAEP